MRSVRQKRDDNSRSKILVTPEKGNVVTCDVAVVVSRYNATVTNALRDGAVRAWQERSDGLSGLEVIEAPGAYELTSLAMAAAMSGRFDGVVALGCLIKGGTRHDEYIAYAVANGLTQVTLMTGVPVAFGVITALNARQARDRAGGSKGNKGEEAMNALLDTLISLRLIEDDQTDHGLPAKARLLRVADKAEQGKRTKKSSTRVGTTTRQRSEKGR